MAKKPKKENGLDYIDDLEIEESDDKIYQLQGERELVYDSVTYTSYWNDTFNAYDILKIYVNGSSGKTKTEYIRTKFQHDYQVHAEILKKLNDDFVKKGKK